MQDLTCLLWNPCMWTHKLGRSPHGSLESAGSGSCLHLCSHGRMDSGPHDTLSDMVNHHRSKHQQRTYVHQTTVNLDLLWHLFTKYALAKINASHSISIHYKNTCLIFGHLSTVITLTTILQMLATLVIWNNSGTKPVYVHFWIHQYL